MKTNLQTNSHIPGQEEKQETREKPHTSQGLVLVGDEAEKFRKMALDCIKGYEEIKPILNKYEEEKERERLEEKREKPTLEEICKLLRDSGNDWLIVSAELIEKSGNIDEKDSIGDTALHNSSRLGLTDIVDKLLKAGADIEARDNGGWTPLMFTSRHGNTETVKLLLDRGADIEARCNNGRTSLIYASNSGKTEVVKLLLDRGAKVNEKNNYGKTALNLADNQEIRDLLISYGGVK